MPSAPSTRKRQPIASARKTKGAVRGVAPRLSSRQLVRTIASLPLVSFRNRIHSLSPVERKLLSRELTDAFGFANGLPQSATTNKLVTHLSKKMDHLKSPVKKASLARRK